MGLSTRGKWKWELLRKERWKFHAEEINNYLTFIWPGLLTEGT